MSCGVIRKLVAGLKIVVMISIVMVIKGLVHWGAGFRIIWQVMQKLVTRVNGGDLYFLPSAVAYVALKQFVGHIWERGRINCQHGHRQEQGH